LQEYSSSLKKESLFNRHKSYHIFTNPDGSLYATASLADAYHEILLSLSFSQDGLITEISGSFLRVPREECREGLKPLNTLIGQNISKMKKKELAVFVGGCFGCTHILEMCYDLGLVLAN
jgi:hypothetical protein